MPAIIEPNKGTSVVRSTCGICQIGCGVLVHVDNGRVIKVEGDPDSPLSRGGLCSKGRASLEYLYHPDRLKHPLKQVGDRGEGKWQQISWDEAINTIAKELTKARDNYGAESVAFISGAARVGEDYPQRLANAFGSPNNAGTAHVCMVPRVRASEITYGFYAIPDYEYPPACIVVWGKNMAETLHHAQRRVIQAVEDGAKLMVIDPREIDLVAKADLWLQLRPGADLALALGMINVIVSEEIYDKAFVENWTVGFDQLKVHVQDYSLGQVEEITWVPAETIRKAARFYALNKPACIQWGNAIDHGVNSFQAARAICILRAITGNLGIPGGESQWSLPPQLSPEQLHLQDKMTEDKWRRRVGAKYDLMQRRGLPQPIVKAILEEDPYPIHAAFVQGANPLVTWTNAQEVYKAFKKLDFLVVVDMFMTPTAALADIVLPVATYLEFDAVVIPPYSYAVILPQRKVATIAECRSDYEISSELARKLGLGEYFWDTEEQCLDATLRPTGLTFRELKKAGFISGTKHYRKYEADGFATPSGKVELYSSQLKERGFDPLPTYHEPPETPYSDPELAKEYPLIFTSRKSEPFRHSDGRQIATLRGLHPEPVISIHPETAGKLGIKDGDWVCIETRRGKIRQKAVLTTGIDPRVVMADYAWWFPEKGASELYGWAESNVNILTDDKPPFNREMGSTNLRGILCKVYKA